MSPPKMLLHAQRNKPSKIGSMVCWEGMLLKRKGGIHKVVKVAQQKKEGRL